MTEQTSNLQIVLRSGDSNQTAVGLTANEPVDPFTVGTAGTWPVMAAGVAEVHAYLFYDGAGLYVASVDIATPVAVNGQPVGTDWTPVAAGTEIAMGQARLGVEGESWACGMELEPQGSEKLDRGKRPKPPKPSAPDPDEATVLRPMASGGAPPPAPVPARIEEGHKAKRKKLKIRQSARENQPKDDESTRFAPLDGSGPAAPLPAAGRPPPGVIHGEGALPPSASTPPPAPSAPSAPSAAPFAPPGVSSAPSGPPPSPPGGVGAFSSPGVGSPPATGAPVPGPPPSSPGAASFPGNATMQADPPVQGAASPPGPVPPESALVTTQSAAKKRGPLQPIFDQWKGASIPQRAILIMMPFAFAAMFVIFDEEQPPPPKPGAAASSASVDHTSAASASAPAPVASAAKTGAVPAASAPEPPADAGSEQDAGELAEGETTKERKAADALAAGQDEEALALYEELAKAHPDNESFRAAARILRARLEKE